MDKITAAKEHRSNSCSAQKLFLMVRHADALTVCVALSDKYKLLHPWSNCFKLWCVTKFF